MECNFSAKMKPAKHKLSIIGVVFLLLIISGFIFQKPANGVITQLPEIPGYYVAADDAGAWPDILHCLGLQAQMRKAAQVLIFPEGYAGEIQTTKLEDSRIIILTGGSTAAGTLGIKSSKEKVLVRRVHDKRRPKLEMAWKEPINVPVFSMPPQADVLMREMNHGAPLMAVLKVGRASILWLATPPGREGYERYPYLLQTLLNMGLNPLFQSRRLWAFFDPGYPHNQDYRELAREWRQMGLCAVHVGAWYYFEADSHLDSRLRDLISACHHEGIKVYAWLELPHVSVSFWRKNPRWREQTASGRDAAVDWRLLMNLVNPDCCQAVAKGIGNMVRRFDWDGVNLGELYFDGPEGVRNLSDFTPLNQDVREEVRKMHGFDPLELFQRKKYDPVKMKVFLDYRVDLAARLQEFWVEELEAMQKEKPGLDLVLTYVDDRFDTTMRDAIGADAARSIKGTEHHNLTFIVEDPYTLWHLGPKRYREIADRYKPLTSEWERLGVDINIVEREKGFPTRKQVGVELAQLIHTAAESFPHVMYYYTGSIDPFDAPLLPFASAVVTQVETNQEAMIVDSPYGVWVRWPGEIALDNNTWYLRDDPWVWVPAGRHVLRPR
jgi:hypothetical protein